MYYELNINPFHPEFQFLNERDMVEFLIVRYLFHDREIFDYYYSPEFSFMRSGSYEKFDIISYPSFQPYTAIIEQTRLFFKSLRSNYSLDSIHHYLSSIPGTSNNLAYGYCRLPGIPLDDFHENRESEVIDQLLALGFNPTGKDRWGRSLHTMFLLTESHWDVLFNHYHYPLLSPYFYSSPLFLFVSRLVPLNVSFGSLRAILLSESTLIKILIKSSPLFPQLKWTQTLLNEIKYRLLDEVAFIVNQNQISIIFETLIQFRNKLDLLSQIKYSPPFGKFPGGIEYHSSYTHFLSVR